MAQIPKTGTLHISDVRNALGENTTDLGSLCKSAKVNKWSALKPVSLPQFPLTWGSEANFDGVTAVPEKYAGYGFDLKNIVSPTYIGIEYLKWNYKTPSGGANSPYRLNDFYGYLHEAVPVIRIPDTFTGVNEINAHGAPVLQISIERHGDGIPGQLTLADFDEETIHPLKDWYFALYIPQGMWFVAREKITSPNISESTTVSIDMALAPFADLILPTEFEFYFMLAEKRNLPEEISSSRFCPLPLPDEQSTRNTVVIRNDFPFRLGIISYGEANLRMSRARLMRMPLELYDTPVSINPYFGGGSESIAITDIVGVNTRAVQDLELTFVQMPSGTYRFYSGGSICGSITVPIGTTGTTTVRFPVMLEKAPASEAFDYGAYGLSVQYSSVVVLASWDDIYNGRETEYYQVTQSLLIRTGITIGGEAKNALTGSSSNGGLMLVSRFGGDELESLNYAFGLYANNNASTILMSNFDIGDGDTGSIRAVYSTSTGMFSLYFVTEVGGVEKTEEIYKITRNYIDNIRVMFTRSAAVVYIGNVEQYRLSGGFAFPMEYLSSMRFSIPQNLFVYDMEVSL